MMELQMRKKKNRESDALPNITCYVCKKSRANAQFSKSQLGKLHRAIRNRGGVNLKTQQLAKCMACSNSQTVELQCHTCGNILDVNQFSKNQRTRENPFCLLCVNYQLSLEAGGNPPVMQASDEEDAFAELADMAETNDSDSLPDDSVPEESLYEESLDEESLFEDSLADEDRSTSQKTGVLIRAESEAGDSAKPIQGKSGFSKIKAHYVPSFVEAPTPAPGHTADGHKGPSEGPWKGAKYL